MQLQRKQRGLSFGVGCQNNLGHVPDYAANISRGLSRTSHAFVVPGGAIECFNIMCPQKRVNSLASATFKWQERVISRPVRSVLSVANAVCSHLLSSECSIPPEFELVYLSCSSGVCWWTVWRNEIRPVLVSHSFWVHIKSCRSVTIVPCIIMNHTDESISSTVFGFLKLVLWFRIHFIFWIIWELPEKIVNTSKNERKRFLIALHNTRNICCGCQINYLVSINSWATKMNTVVLYGACTPSAQSRMIRID
jgi:hypothetical protein